jgi:hypothetical protein
MRRVDVPSIRPQFGKAMHFKPASMLQAGVRGEDAPSGDRPRENSVALVTPGFARRTHDRGWLASRLASI